MSEELTVSKARRQRLIGELIRSAPVVSQEDLVERLAEQGLAVTQATVSRDLAELGAVKVRRRDVLSYALPGDFDAPEIAETRLRRLLTEWVVGAEAAGNLVVVKTPPATAHVIASALDHAGWPEVAGTIAGDDTLMLIARNGHAAEDLAAKILALTGQERA